jgi:hypothetical protein
MDRPHLDAEPLQREYRGRIADMAVDHVRLDRQQVHRVILAIAWRRVDIEADAAGIVSPPHV